MTMISTQMRVICAHKKADGIAYAQATGAPVSSIGDTLQHMRALAAQAAEGALGAWDRKALQIEYRLCLDHIEAIGMSPFADGERTSAIGPAYAYLSAINLTANITLTSNGEAFDGRFALYMPEWPSRSDIIVIRPSDAVDILDTVLRRVNEACSKHGAS
jgi:hypothetical protein